ncbi:MAG: nucleotidyltransferase domain-containing protein [Candidatus Thermoplasmatota archaeon]
MKKFLKKEKKIVFAYLHGSFLTDTFRDIDIGIYLSNVDSKKKMLDYELYLEERLNSKTGFVFDIRVLNHAPVSFCYSVIKNGEVLFSRDENQRADFESLSWVKYFDFDFYRKRYMRDALGIKVIE